MRPEPSTTDNLTAPRPGASKIVQLDLDPIAIGRNYRADVPLVGDAKLTLRDLISALKPLVSNPATKRQRLQRIAKAMREYEDMTELMTKSDAMPIKPQRIMREISKVLGPRDIVVSDTANQIAWTVRFLKMKGSGMTYIPCGGTLGASFAMSMGVAFAAEKDQRVLNVIGDGGMGYNLAELETAKRYNDKHVPFVALVNNNSSLGQVRYWFEDWTEKTQALKYADFSDLSYARIAQSFGCYGVTVERPNELAEAVQVAFRSGEPAIVDVITDKREYLPFGHRRHVTEERYSGFPLY